MEEKFEKAFEEAIKNGENNELVERDRKEVQNAIAEQQKIYIELQRSLGSDLRRAFNVSSEEMRKYASNIGSLLVRLEVINKIIADNAKVYNVSIEREELPFNEEALGRREEPNYFSAQPKTITPEITEARQPQPSAPKVPEVEQPQTPRPEGPETMQPQVPKPEGPETMQPQVPKPEVSEAGQPQATNPEKENQMKVTKKDLELAKKANDFYMRKNEWA